MFGSVSEANIQQFPKRRDSQRRFERFVFLRGSWRTAAFYLLDTRRFSRINVPWKRIPRTLQNHRGWEFTYQERTWKRRRTLRLQRDQSGWCEHSYSLSSGIELRIDRSSAILGFLFSMLLVKLQTVQGYERTVTVLAWIPTGRFLYFFVRLHRSRRFHRLSSKLEQRIKRCLRKVKFLCRAVHSEDLAQKSAGTRTTNLYESMAMIDSRSLVTALFL